MGRMDRADVDGIPFGALKPNDQLDPSFNRGGGENR
jgi:hypothetical protein